MNNWLRLWHDMPTDPKWRVVARKSGQRIGDVIAVFNFLLVSASENDAERGVTQCDADVLAAALDMETDSVTAIVTAMQGLVMQGDITHGRLMGWEKRQPKREDSSAERTRDYRERHKASRDASDAKTRPEKDKDKTPLPPSGGGSFAHGAGVESQSPKIDGLSARVMLNTKRRAEDLNRDYSLLCRTYNAWIAEKGAPGCVDTAFPAWIESYTKGERL